MVTNADRKRGFTPTPNFKRLFRGNFSFWHQREQSSQLENWCRGFTLIELLVVIAIIGILAALVTASISDSRAKSRDAARLSQLNELETALELYYLDHDQYPVVFAVPLTDLEGELSPTYIRAIPDDPLYTGTLCQLSSDGGNYCYNSNTGQGYTLLAAHEGSDSYCKVTNNDPGWNGTFPDCSDL